MTIALARENPDYQINARCPGWCTTDLGSQAGQPLKSVGKHHQYCTLIMVVAMVLTISEDVQNRVPRYHSVLASEILEA